MQNDFEAKYIKKSKELLSQDLNIAQRHLHNYKEIQKELSREATLWEKIKAFFGKHF